MSELDLDALHHEARLEDVYREFPNPGEPPALTATAVMGEDFIDVLNSEGGRAEVEKIPAPVIAPKRPALERRRVRLLRLQDLSRLPLPVWRVYGLLSGLTLLWGPPGGYKTFLCISWAVAISSGRAWCGRKVRQGVVVFIVGEGALRSFYNRVTAAAIAQGIPAAEVSSLPIYATEGPVDLSRWDGIQAQELVAEALAITAVVGPAAAVFVDTVSRCLPGEENSQESMQGFVGALDSIRQTLACEVVAVHHSNASDERERGSSVLPAAVDGNLRINAGEPDEQGRVPLSLFAVKLKEAESGRDPIVRLMAVKAVVEGPDGFPLRDEAGLAVTTRYLTIADPEDGRAEDSLDASLLDSIPSAGIAAGALAESLKRRKKTVLADLHRLKRAGLVTITGKGSSTRWVTSEPASSQSVPGSRNQWEPVEQVSQSVPPVPASLEAVPGTETGNHSGNGRHERQETAP